MLGIFRPLVTRIMRRPALFLGRLGISPNIITIIGLIVAIWASFFAWKGELYKAAVIYILSGTFDMLDGDLARLKGIGSNFGAILDSVVDRICEISFLGSLCFFFLLHDQPTNQEYFVYALLIFVFMITSLLISYAKSRAELFVEFGKKGLMQRTERMVFTFILLLLHQKPWVFLGLLVVMNLLNLYTFFQRMFEAYQFLREKEKIKGIG
jgi:CDP-diacylglycerol--glycerol-3-phosphate 3-phosphatidyltransferase